MIEWCVSAGAEPELATWWWRERRADGSVTDEREFASEAEMHDDLRRARSESARLMSLDVYRLDGVLDGRYRDEALSGGLL